MVMLIGSLCLTNLIARRGKEVIRSCQFPRLSGSAAYATDLDRPTNLAAALNRGYLQAPAVGAANDSGLKAVLQPSGTCRIAWPAPGKPAELPHQVVWDLEGGIRIIRIDLGAGLVHAHDERGIALGDLVRDNLGYQFGGVALADDHQAPGH